MAETFPTAAGLARATVAAAATLLGALGFAPASSASVVTFGSALASPATQNSATDLTYVGSDIALPGSVFHIPHDGADSALWNTGQVAPASGQILSVRLEGCAEQPAGAPAPLTQIHFQDLVPQPGGGVKVNVSTQAFDISVCGQGGASGSTVTTYSPTNFCVAQGDYVDFNDEGGFLPGAPPPYPSGVPYMVIGSAPGSTLLSFIRNNGIGNGATLSPGDTSNHDGYASNPDREVMLQATLGSGPDATPLCLGGTQGASTQGGYGSKPALPPIRVSPQADGVNHSRIVSVAIYCRPRPGCHGVATLSALGTAARAGHGRLGLLGATSFNLPGNKTGHVAIRVSAALIGMLRKHRAGLPASLSVAAVGTTVTQAITLRIF